MKLIIFGILLLSQLNAKDNVSYFFSTGLNYNIHNADFTNLPDISNYTYSKYGINSNIKYNLGLGLNYRFNEKLFNFFNSYSISLNYNDNSIQLNREELLGNFIKENEYYKIYSEVPIDVSLGLIGVKNTFWVDLPSNFAAGINLGANFIMNNNFSQIEIAKNNKDYTFENGTGSREKYSGKIPKLNSLLFNLGLEAKYLYKLNDNFSLSPTLAYNLFIPSINQEVSWNISSINFNLSLNYQPIEKVIIPVPIEPEPITAEKPKEIELYYYVDAYLNNKKLDDKSEISLDYYSVIEREQYSILPIIYFQSGSTQLLKKNTSGLFELAIKSLIENIANNIKSNNIKSVSIKTGKFVNSDKKLFEERVNSVLEMFVKLGVNKNIFKIEYNEVAKLSYRYDELKQEEDKLTFSFNNNKQDLISFTYLQNESNFYTENSDFLFRVNYNLDENVVNNLKFNGNNINNDREFHYNITKDEKIKSFDSKMAYFSNPISIKTNNLSDTFNLNINYFKTDSSTVSNQIEKGKYRFILGYFDFDSYNFAAIDNDVLSFVKQAINDKKKVKLLPMTDNIGDASYNLELAKKRANSAINLLSISSEQCEIDLTNKQFFSNQHPYGRTLNRSVIVEIYE